MDAVTLKELEEMTICGYCKQKFNDTDQIPKLLTCKHYFCLSCIHPMMKVYIMPFSVCVIIIESNILTDLLVNKCFVCRERKSFVLTVGRGLS